MPKAPSDHTQEIVVIDQRLQALEYEKSQLLARKVELESYSADLVATSSTLSPKDKVALFQKLFFTRNF